MSLYLYRRNRWKTPKYNMFRRIITSVMIGMNLVPPTAFLILTVSFVRRHVWFETEYVTKITRRNFIPTRLTWLTSRYAENFGLKVCRFFSRHWSPVTWIWNQSVFSKNYTELETDFFIPPLTSENFRNLSRAQRVRDVENYHEWGVG